MCLLVSSLVFLIHPSTTDKLFTPTNWYIRYQSSTRYTINIIMTIMGHYPRARYTPCLLGLIPKGRTNPIYLLRSVFLEGFKDFHPKDPRSHINNISKDNAYSFPSINYLNIIYDYSRSLLLCNHTMNHFHNIELWIFIPICVPISM